MNNLNPNNLNNVFQNDSYNRKHPLVKQKFCLQIQNMWYCCLCGKQITCFFR